MYKFLSLLLVFSFSVFCQVDTSITISKKSIINWDSLNVIEDLSITNNFMKNARTSGMGISGVAVHEKSDGQNNPAALGFENSSIMEQVAPVAPNSNLSGFISFGTHFKYKLKEKDLVISGSYKHFNLDEGVIVNDSGWEISKFNDAFNEIDVSIGFKFCSKEKSTHSIGGALKLIIGSQFYNKYNKSRVAVLLDAGYLVRILDLVNFGLSIKNLGKQLSGIEHSIEQRSGYGITAVNKVVKLNDDYTFTPITLTLGGAITHQIVNKDLKLLKPSFEISVMKEFNEGKNLDLENLTFNMGCETELLNSFSLRGGLSLSNSNEDTDYLGHFGVGIHLFNHFHIDTFWILSENSNVFYHKQRGLSLTIDRLFNWNKIDKKWWLRN